MTQQKEITPTAQAMELWQIVLHRKWFVLILGAILSALAIVAISLRPVYYSASITVLVDPQKIPERYVSDSVTMDQLRFDTLTQQILSSTRLQQVIDELQLYPELQQRLTHEEIVDYMRKNIAVLARQGGDRNMSAFTITFKGTNPKLVAQVATRLADSFIKWDLGARERQATETSRFLETQLQEAKKEMDQAEAKLSAFRIEHHGELPEQLESYQGTLARLQSQLQANADTLNRLDTEKLVLRHSNETTPPPTPLAAIAVKTERQRLMQQQKQLEDKLAALRTRYSDEFPEVMTARLAVDNGRRQLQESPADALPAAAETAQPSPAMTANNERMQLLAREIGIRQDEQKRLMSDMQAMEVKANIAPVLEQRLSDLMRDSQSTKTHYQSLVDKTFSADIATDLERQHAQERFMILDPAQVPEKPIKKSGWKLFALMIPGCFLFSSGCAVLIDKIKGTISTESILRRALPSSVPVIGRIPLIQTPTLARRQLRIQAAAVAGMLVSCLAAAALLWRIHPHS